MQTRRWRKCADTDVAVWLDGEPVCTADIPEFQIADAGRIVAAVRLKAPSSPTRRGVSKVKGRRRYVAIADKQIPTEAAAENAQACGRRVQYARSFQGWGGLDVRPAADKRG